MSNWKENIKSKMEKRELDVSSSAWDKLESQLNDEQATSSSHKKGFYWMGIAASICLFIMLGALLFNQEKQTPITPSIVKEDIKKIEKAKNIDIQPTLSPKLVVNKTINNAKEHIQKKEIKTLQPIETKKQEVLKIKELDLIQVEKEEKLIAVNQDSILETTEMVTTKTDNKTPEEYLAEALMKNRLTKSQKLVVNQENLLDHVEDEIYEEKSPTILQKITEQAKKFQVAFSERNQAK